MMASSRSAYDHGRHHVDGRIARRSTHHAPSRPRWCSRTQPSTSPCSRLRASDPARGLATSQRRGGGPERDARPSRLGAHSFTRLRRSASWSSGAPRRHLVLTPMTPVARCPGLAPDRSLFQHDPDHERLKFPLARPAGVTIGAGPTRNERPAPGPQSMSPGRYHLIPPRSRAERAERPYALAATAASGPRAPTSTTRQASHVPDATSWPPRLTIRARLLPWCDYAHTPSVRALGECVDRLTASAAARAPRSRGASA